MISSKDMNIMEIGEWSEKKRPEGGRCGLRKWKGREREGKGVCNFV